MEITVSLHHAALSPPERLRIASDMLEVARAVVASSLPPGLTDTERRVAIGRRFYGTELPEAAWQAMARHQVR